MGRWAASDADRLAWSRAHASLWAGFPWAWPAPAAHPRRAAFLSALRKAQLYSAHASNSALWIAAPRLMVLAGARIERSPTGTIAYARPPDGRRSTNNG